MLIKLTVVIILQYIHITHHYVVQLKLKVLYANYISV